MASFSKYLLLLLFVAGQFTILTAPAQRVQPLNTSFNEFIDTTIPGINTNKKNSAFLVSCDPLKLVAWSAQNKSVRILRRLSDSIFIASLNEYSASAPYETECRWIKKANDHWKMSPLLLGQKNSGKLIFPASFFVSVFHADKFIKSMNDRNLVINNKTVAEVFIALVNNRNEFNNLLADENVFFISRYMYPKEELQINDLDLSVNKINLVHSKMAFLNGTGSTVSIKENLPDTSDIDYAARYRYNPGQATGVTSHASIMATMAAGAGNSYYLGRGVANSAIITSSNFSNLLPDADTNYKLYHITVQNHSYGVGIETFYGPDAAAFDASALRNDSLLFIFSAGNDGNLSASAGNYTGIAGYGNLTGSFKMAKNIITVGAVDSFGIVAKASSRGPAFDGRIKPELVAYGEDGSSGAAALVSGTVAILQQAYKISGNGQLPSSALIKAILLNSADDIGPPGPDYTSGYGNLNAFKATQTILGKKYFSGSVGADGRQSFSLNIPAGINRAKFTLVWNDLPAATNTYKALINDLDLELQLPASGQGWKPWVLNSFPNTDSLTAMPVRKRDSLNNVEQIALDDPAPGNYIISVHGFDVSSPAQTFYIAWQLDTANNFSWNFPSATDNIFSGTSNIIRYNTNILPVRARAMYSIDRGNSWLLIDSLVNLSKEYIHWNTPDTNALAILKMQAGTQEFLSDTFTISKKLDFKLGFNCADSVLWYWNKLPGIRAYEVSALTGAYLQPVAVTADTSYIFNKSIFPFKYFAVAPVIGSQTGIKSYTTDFTVQGIDCYITNFIADLQNDATIVQLQIGTNYHIKKIIFEKLQQGGFTLLQEINGINDLKYRVTDNKIRKGINTYRARIELSDGRMIYTVAASVFYFGATNIVVYPNPVLSGDNLTVQFKDLQNQHITISDILGRTVFSVQANSTSLQIPFYYSKGIYFITIFNPETNQSSLFKIMSY